MVGEVERVQLPCVQSPERGTDSAFRERVGKTVTLQGNLDPCALYASEVSIRVPVYVCEFVYSHGCGYGCVYHCVFVSLLYLFVPLSEL